MGAGSPTRMRFAGVNKFAIVSLAALGFGGAYWVFSDYWWAFLIAGGLLTGMSFFIQKPTPALHGEVISDKESHVMQAGQLTIPQSWDPTEIGLQIRRRSHDASLVKTFLDNVFTRFVVGQDTQTARVRIEFLKNKLEELKLSKELQASLDELQFRELSLDIKQLELENQKNTLQSEGERAREISDLKRQRDALKIKLEIAEMNKQMEEIQGPAKKAPERTSDEIRKEKKEQIELAIKNCERDLAELRTDGSLNEDGKRRRENILSKKLDGLYEELEKYA